MDLLFNITLVMYHIKNVCVRQNEPFYHLKNPSIILQAHIFHYKGKLFHPDITKKV